MSWIFWVLLAITAAIFALSFSDLLTAEANFTLWFFGSVLLLMAILWVSATFVRRGTRGKTAAQ